MKPILNKLAATHLNTVIGTVNWELMEPAEGRSNFTLVDAEMHREVDAKCRPVSAVVPAPFFRSARRFHWR